MSLGIYPIESTEPNAELPIWNVGTNLSPLFQKQITGYLAFGTYPFQTTCRSGLECSIPAIDQGKRKAEAYHSRHELQKILTLTPLTELEELACHAVPHCVDCENWSFSKEDVPRLVITLHG
jgi:putative lipase involved disintegration of autophagic bodies